MTRSRRDRPLGISRLLAPITECGETATERAISRHERSWSGRCQPPHHVGLYQNWTYYTYRLHSARSRRSSSPIDGGQKDHFSSRNGWTDEWGPVVSSWHPQPVLERRDPPLNRPGVRSTSGYVAERCPSSALGTSPPGRRRGSHSGVLGPSRAMSEPDTRETQIFRPTIALS